MGNKLVYTLGSAIGHQLFFTFESPFCLHQVHLNGPEVQIFHILLNSQNHFIYKTNHS